MAPVVASLNTHRARSYMLRLPLFTRFVLCLIAAAAVIGVQSAFDIRKWGALVPSKVSITAAYRISTYPLIHVNLIHAVLNALALAPLLERFEAEHGTFTTLALFFGPLTTIPSVLYLLIESFILGGNTAVMGSSIWVFTLLAIESIRTYRTNPYLVIRTYQIPTWITPLLMILVVAALIPGTSLLGHLCGVGVGYLYGLGHLKFINPPEKLLRWAETRLNLLARLPHYVSVDQKTYGRFGILPSNNAGGVSPPVTLMGSTQRLGP